MADENDGMGLELEVPEEGEGGETAAAETPSELEALKTKTSAYEKLLTDPDVAALLKAKETGKGLKIIIGEAAEPPEPAEETFELPDAAEIDDLSPSQVLSLAMKAQKAMMSGALKEALEPIAGVVGRLEEAGLSQRREKIKTEVDALTKRFPDLPKYGEGIVALASDGKMSIQEAYMLSRTRAGLSPLPTPKPRGGAEMPTSITIKAHAGDKKPARLGAKGFAEDLREVLANVEYSVGE